MHEHLIAACHEKKKKTKKRTFDWCPRAFFFDKLGLVAVSLLDVTTNCQVVNVYLIKVQAYSV